MLTQEQYDTAKTQIDKATSIETIASALEEPDKLYLKGRWNSFRVCQEASDSNDLLAVKLYCLAEFRIWTLTFYPMFRDWHKAEMTTIQQILMSNRRTDGFHGF